MSTLRIKRSKIVLMWSQFPLPPEVKKNVKNVQDWLRNTEDGTQLGSLEAQPDQRFHGLSSEEIEKAAAHLIDGIKNVSFDPAKCVEADQKVPTGDFKTNFLNEVEIHPALILMNCIKSLFTEDNTTQRNLYFEILKYASLEGRSTQGNSPQIPEESKRPRQTVDFETLKNYHHGGYFSELRLTIKKSGKQKERLVRAVENYVTDKFAQAAEAKSAILFTQYGSIPEVVQECDRERNMNIDPFKLANYGVVLQRAIHHEIVARCLEFLEHVGFTLLAEDVADENKLNLSSSNESAWSLSQGTSNSQADSSGSQSQQDVSTDQFDEAVLQNNDLVNGNQYFAPSPGGSPEEYVRGDSQGSNLSSFGSQRSWSLYTQTPPQLSIPDQDGSGASPIIYEEPGFNQLEDYELSAVDLYTLQDRADGSQSSYGSGEPRRRRPRLE